MEIDIKPPCEYGSNCYRKNPDHFKEFSHPGETTKERKKKVDEKLPVSKKPKLDIVKERVERPMINIAKEPVKTKKDSPQNQNKNTKVQDTKKMKQTTLNFFTKPKTSSESEAPTITAPRKETQKNNEKDGESSKLRKSPRKNASPKKLIRAESSQKVEDMEDIMTKAMMDYISDSEGEGPSKSPVLSKRNDKTKKLNMSPKVTETQKEKLKPQSPEKLKVNKRKVSPKKTGTHYLSDSDDEIPASIEVNEKTDSQKAEQSTEETPNDSTATKPSSDKKTIVEESDAEEEDEEEKEESKEQPKTTSWTYIKKTPQESSENSSKKNKSDSKEDIIKNLFLVDMPPDFYSFFDFCKHVDSSAPLKCLQVCGLRLVGSYDVLAGNKKLIEKDSAVCHWRYYYDPPEFQTVLSTKNGFHMGYWRDVPKEPPAFVASNNSQDCIFKIEAENIFGALDRYLKEYEKTCDPFVKLKIQKFQNSLNKWSEEHNITFGKTSENIIRERKKRVKEKRLFVETYNKVGIVIPYDPKTELGYRPIVNANGKKANVREICKLITDSSDNRTKDKAWDDLQYLITAANIANDESDFGTSLHLGTELFCMGSPEFHDTIECLLPISYSLLRRSEFGEIIKAHLKNRRKETMLSIV